jgi:Cu(I)/Ag(I) efflux system membrane fusion protein
MNDPFLNCRASAQASERRSVASAPRPFISRRSTLLTLHVFLPILAAVFLASCTQGGAGAKPADVDYYTCTMHPSVKKQNPTDKCPICSMDLVPVKKRDVAASEHPNLETSHVHHTAGAPRSTLHAHDEVGSVPENVVQPGEFMVPVERQQQIGVTYATIQKRPFTHTVRTVGMAAYDKRRHWDYVTRVEGYVKELFVFSRGEPVEKGAPILTIYSPELLITQSEFVDVLKMRDQARAKGNQAVLQSAEKLLESAKQRLNLWNISDKEIAELEATRKPHEHVTLYSPFKGVVQDIGVDQGRKVMNGDHLVDIADLTVAWVWAQFYQDELPLLKQGLPVTITTSSYPGERLNGKISILDPFINDALRTGRVRIDVENPDLKLRPDMYVDVELTMDMGEGVAVPVPAVLPTGQHNIVFVDRGEGRLEPRFIELGRKFGDFYEVKSGLKETERVVTSANFLIDAEAKVQGALKSW